MALGSLSFPRGFMYQPGHSASSRNPDQTILTDGTRGNGYLFRGFLRRLSKYPIGRFIFKPQSKTKPLSYFSLCPRCPRAAKRIPLTQDLDCVSKRMARKQVSKKLSLPSLYQELNQIQLSWGCSHGIAETGC